MKVEEYLGVVPAGWRVARNAYAVLRRQIFFGFSGLLSWSKWNGVFNKWKSLLSVKYYYLPFCSENTFNTLLEYFCSRFLKKLPFLLWLSRYFLVFLWWTFVFKDFCLKSGCLLLLCYLILWISQQLKSCIYIYMHTSALFSVERIFLSIWIYHFYMIMITIM